MRTGRFILLVFSLLIFHTGSAQCAMCRATAKSSKASDGSSILDGLETGIIFLMIIPYILLFLLFRKKIVKFFREFNSMQ